MKVKFLIAALFFSLVAAAQPSNYIKFNTRGRWIAGMFDSTLHVPRFNGSPSLRTGGSSMDGAIAIDTTNSIMYFYSGGAWKRANLDTSAYAVTNVYRKTASDSVFYVKGGVHTFAFKDSTGGSGWALTGNAGTDTATNFIGTTDNKPLVFKTNNTEYLRLNEFGRVGVNANSNIIGKLHIRTNNISATQTDSTGLFLENSTVSTASVKLQSSPAIVYKANGWENSGLVNQPYLWSMDVLPFSPIIGGTPTSSFRIRQNKNNEGYGTVFNIEGSGTFSFNSVSGGSTTTWGGTLNGASLKNLGETFIAGSSSLLLGSVKNTAVGSYTLYNSNGTGQSNTAVGAGALYYDTSGSFNTAVGAGALYYNKNGSQNTAVGTNSLYNNITGIKNTSFGAGAMENNISGDDNTAIGQDALLANTTGIRNIGIGWNGFANNFTGYQNVGIGYGAGKTITNGNNNTILGAFAAWDTPQNDTITGAVIIGHSATASEDSTVVLGNDYIKKTHLKGVVYAPFTAGSATTSDSALAVNRTTGALEMRPVAGGGGSSSLSSITAATATNTINNGNYKQEWQWDNLSSGYGLDLTSSTTSPASTVGLLNSTIDGANSNAGITSYAIIGQNYKTGTSSTNYGASFTASGGTTNIGARFTAAGGTNNYAITVPSSGGSVGIGTETPASKLHTVGTVRHATLGTASGDTTTNKPVGINSSGDIIPMTYWPGGGGSTSPAGNNRNIQFNSNGTFAGNDSLKFEGGALKLSNNTPLKIDGINVINYDNNTNVTYVGGSYITSHNATGYSVFGSSKASFDHTNGALTLGATIGDSLFTNNGSSHQVGNARFDARVNVAKASGYATNINGSLGANDFATKGYVDSTRSIESTYTPSLTNTTNISASTAYTTHYQRIDDVVHVWGEVDIDATTAATISEMGLSLPTTTDIAQTYDLAGTASFEDNTIVQIKGDVTNNRAMFRFTPVSNTNNKYSFHFTYKHYTP